MDYTALAERVSQLHCDHLRELYQLGEALAAQGEEGVLLCLRQHGESVLSGELMAMMGLTTGRIANILRQMERKGLVSRRQDQGDRRRVYVSLTAEGIKRADEKYQLIVGSHQRFFEYLGEADAREAVRIMERCLAFMNGLT
ncbi:MAG: winged helix-turn-helix transcriptional regulator [Clostridia bacterium]|nr:winged helix-turn-helix transcriptional regulator [Clostridia bacterium]